MQSTAITTASGVDRYLKIQAFEGAVLEETVTEVDGKGRPVTSSFMDGTSVAFQDWCLHGPQKIINRDGSETALAYDPFGRVKRSVDGESGIVFEYEYDPMGRVTRQTRSAGGQQLESRWTYGLDGTLLYAKDESGHEVSFSGRYVNGLLELTRSETGLGDVVETFWADGRLKSVSGDGAAVRFSCERGITDNRLWIKKINPEKPGEWVKTWYAFNGSFDATERPGGVFDRVSFDSSLMPESSVSGDGVRRLFSHDHRHSSLPVFSGVALGGGDSLDLARDPCCLSNAYAFTAGGLQSSVFSFPEDGSGEPFESYSSSVSPDGLSGSFTAEGHPGNWFCDAPPSTGTFTKTVNLPDGSVETYVFRKFLLRKFIRRDADSMRKSTVTYRYDSFGALAACTTDARGFKETVSLGRDAARRLNAIRSSSRGTTLLHRDAASGRVSSIASPAGLTALGWLPCGELGSVRRDAGPLYSRTLDPFGRADSLTCRFSPAAASTLGYTYADDGGFSSKERDGVTQTAVAARRADGRPTDVSLPGGAAVTMTYDPAGRLTWESWSDPGNPGGSVSFNRKWHRDGRLRAAAQTGGAVLSNHVFRAGGKTVAERTDFRAPDSADTSVTVSLGGPGGRKDGVLVAAGGFSGMAMQTGAGYDGVGRVSHQWGDGFYVTYGGPSGGPVTNTCFAVGGSERMVRSVTWSASDGRPARVDYTVDGKLLRRWEYLAEGGRVRFVTRSGGDAYRTDYEYDWAGRLESAHSSVTNVAGGWRSFPGFSFSYAYTAAGDTVRFGPASHADRATASNDLHTDRNWSPYVGVLGRLSATNAGVTVSFGAATNGAEAAAAGVFYAPLDISGLSAPPGTATSGTALVTASFPGCTQDTARVAFSRPAPAETPVYSPRGFLLADSRRTYRWDAPGRLLAVTNTCPAPGCGGSVLAVACAYFPDGRRAAKTVSVCSNGVWSVKRRLEYCWDGWKLAA
ncbi:MAG: hypothetical protein RBU24_07980, partial [Kiritimatiellia bacterium]|nr:hypothetical protein [Kiritimatiellia bacterium]